MLFLVLVQQLLVNQRFPWPGQTAGGKGSSYTILHPPPVFVMVGCFLDIVFHIEQAPALAAEIDDGLLPVAEGVGIVEFPRPNTTTAIANVRPWLPGHGPRQVTLVVAGRRVMTGLAGDCRATRWVL